MDEWDVFARNLFLWFWRDRFRRHPHWRLKRICGWNSCVVEDRWGQHMRVWF